ncbi:StAR-related lipid transfer protein 13 [Nibea albiflora]|uniref:StAR-related lipid transfer protein 13 n=1 Tax=Nibea albiflora TaxID=240163 RepID=A0ACB7F5W0_NIBAL|nr:StAR-related lipid transfer protein 13 [Nibea albiflora]
MKSTCCIKAEQRGRALKNKQSEKRQNMLSAEARVPYSTVSIVLVLLSWRKCALAASKESRDGRRRRRRRRRRRPPESNRKTQKGCFSHRLTVGFQKGKGVAVNQGTAEEKRLSEMVLLSGSSRLSYGLETLFIKDCRFPIDIEWAKCDHHFLDKDALDSLCRRLSTLNKCVEMRLEPRRSKRRGDDCDEEDFCAISTNWTYDRRMRRWRRLNSAVDILRLSDSPTGPQDVSLCDVSDQHDVCSIHSSSSTESEGHRDAAASTTASATATASTSTTDNHETSRSSSRCSSTNKTPSLDTSFSGPPSPGGSSNSGSLPRHVTSGPVLVQEEERMERLHCPSSLQVRPSSRASSSPSSPHTISSSSSNSHSESSSTVSTPSPVTRVRSNCKRSNSGVGGGTTRNNQNHTETEDYRNQINNNNNSIHESLVFQVPHGHKPGTFPTFLTHKHTILSPIIDNTSVNWRTGSFHGYRGRHSCRRGTSSLATGDRDLSTSSSCDVPSPLAVLDHRLSVYDNVPDDQQLSGSEGGSGGSVSDADRIGEESEVSRLLAGEDVFSALDSVLERISDLQQLVSTWSENLSEDDCQRGSSTSSASSSSSSSTSSSQDSPAHGSSAASPCPSSPNHIHLEVQHPEEEEEEEEEETEIREKVPADGEEPKTRSLQPRSSVQQTGEPLPPSILRALIYLKTECLDQVGLFRKSGVKSRIQYLRELVESDPEGISYESQSAFDVADMVKQYFRDLPEPIFTSKLCESFLHIYQYFPKDQQLVAAQAAILLLPDENREALRTLLFFLQDVVAAVDENQMTPTNIAVCLAPSLFHLNTLKRDTNAPRAAGSPEDTLSEDGGGPVSPGQSGGEEEQEERRSKLQLSTQHLLKEAREKSRGWESHPAPEHVELAFKKMDDGFPLWMWRGSVEVEAPQKELLHRLLREQELWEGSLRHAGVIQTLSKDTEVYRYLLQGQGHGLGSRPPQEHLLLRTWQSDPSASPLYLSSVSTEHPEVLLEGVRANVHSCLYLLEPTGARKTRLTHLCRTDTR